jgi:hypothetical protein
MRGLKKAAVGLGAVCSVAVGGLMMWSGTHQPTHTKAIYTFTVITPDSASKTRVGISPGKKRNRTLDC